jgi:hypothetical protein
VIHGITPHLSNLSGQLAIGAIDVIHGFNSWDAFLRRLRDYANDANIRPCTSMSPSFDIDPADLAWMGQLTPTWIATKLMVCFKFPIHHRNDHTLDCCGTLKWLVNVTAKAAIPPHQRIPWSW